MFLKLVVLILVTQNGCNGQRDLAVQNGGGGYSNRQVSASISVGNGGGTGGSNGNGYSHHGWGSGPAYPSPGPSQFPQYSPPGSPVPGGSGPSGNQGRVVNNSILDDEDDDLEQRPVIPTIMGEVDREIQMQMNYNPQPQSGQQPQQNQQPQQGNNGFVPSRPMPMTTPMMTVNGQSSMGNGGGGINGNMNGYNGMGSPMMNMNTNTNQNTNLNSNMNTNMNMNQVMMQLDNNNPRVQQPQPQQQPQQPQQQPQQRPMITGMGDNTLNSMNSMSTGPSGNSGNSNGNTQTYPLLSDGPKIHRFVSVHVPPPEPVIPTRQRPQAQPTQKPDVHYQIVFIKAPTPSPQELQEIQLPPPPEMKTLVYVLLKKPQMSDVVRIQQQRAKPRPNKPEVFFIRYKNKPQNGNATVSTGNTANANNGMNVNMARPNNGQSNNNGNNNGNNDNSNVVYGRQQSGNDAIMTNGMLNNNLNMRQTTGNGVGGGMNTLMTGGGGGGPSGGGYSSSSLESEIADSDFSEESFKKSFSQSSYQQNGQRQLNAGGGDNSYLRNQYGSSHVLG